MPSFKLTYFNGRGRGELARLVFAAAGVQFEDKRISFEEWATLKNEMPQGTLPVLSVDGKVLSQSLAIARYLARNYGLDGKTAFDGGAVNEILDTVTDVMQKIFESSFEKDEAKKTELQNKVASETVPNLLKYLCSKFESNPQSGFVVGDSLTIADLAIMNIIDLISSKKPDVLEDKERNAIKANYEKVKSLPRIHEYLQNRPKTDF